MHVTLNVNLFLVADAQQGANNATPTAMQNHNHMHRGRLPIENTPEQDPNPVTAESVHGDTDTEDTLLEYDSYREAVVTYRDLFKDVVTKAHKYQAITGKYCDEHCVHYWGWEGCEYMQIHLEMQEVKIRFRDPFDTLWEGFLIANNGYCRLLKLLDELKGDHPDLKELYRIVNQLRNEIFNDFDEMEDFGH